MIPMKLKRLSECHAVASFHRIAMMKVKSAFDNQSITSRTKPGNCSYR